MQLCITAVRTGLGDARAYRGRSGLHFSKAHDELHQLPDARDRPWDRLIGKLQARSPDVQAFGAPTHSLVFHCELPRERMQTAFRAAEAHPLVDPHLLTVHGDYASYVSKDRTLGEKLVETAVLAQPRNAGAPIALARMYLVLGRPDKGPGVIARTRTAELGGGDPELKSPNCAN